MLALVLLIPDSRSPAPQSNILAYGDNILVPYVRMITCPSSIHFRELHSHVVASLSAYSVRWAFYGSLCTPYISCALVSSVYNMVIDWVPLPTRAILNLKSVPLFHAYNY